MPCSTRLSCQIIWPTPRLPTSTKTPSAQGRSSTGAYPARGSAEIAGSSAQTRAALVSSCPRSRPPVPAGSAPRPTAFRSRSKSVIFRTHFS